jgi:hypothetical protein
MLSLGALRIGILALFALVGASPEDRLPLRVLYASEPGTEYTAGWKKFLEEHVAEVRAVAHADLTPDLVQAFDVLVIDGELQDGGQYKTKDDRMTLPLRLSQLQGHPVLLMGGVGGQVSTAWWLAGSWGIYGCHCLAPWLVVPPGERPAVMRTPFAIDEETQRRAAPKSYVEHDPDTPAELDVLHVFDPDPVEPGYVTRGDFRALPDAEWIASGINSKSAGHAAILRHGSFVLWGFHGPAATLTSAGRKLFLNSLAYAHKQKGRMVENLRLAAPREELLVFFRRVAPTVERAERAERLDWLLVPGFPDSVLDDPATVQTWFEKARGTLRMPPGGYGFAIDAECAELGLSNDSPKLLEVLAQRLAKTPDDTTANTLLRRYVRDAPAEGAAAWLEANRARLYFTDVGGYVWKLKGERVDTLRPLRVSALPPDHPLRVSGAASEDELVIDLDLRAGWHLYARAEEKFRPLAITVDPKSNYDPGTFALPADKSGRLTGKVRISVPLVRKFVGAGLAVEISFQACDADSCRPPEQVRLEL